MIGALVQIFQNFIGNEYIFFLTEKVVNPKQEQWPEIPTGSPWTNPGGSTELAGVEAYQHCRVRLLAVGIAK
jgi:hypothetical protein